MDSKGGKKEKLSAPADLLTQKNNKNKNSAGGGIDKWQLLLGGNASRKNKSGSLVKDLDNGPIQLGDWVRVTKKKHWLWMSDWMMVCDIIYHENWGW